MKWMRKISFLYMLSLFLPLAGSSEMHSNYRAIVIDFVVGESDRFHSPIVLSDTAEGAEWYRHLILHDSKFDFASIHIVPRSSLADISEKFSVINVQDYKEKALQPSETKVLSLTLCNAEHIIQLKLGKRVSRELVLDFNQRFPNDAALRSEMASLQYRLGTE